MLVEISATSLLESSAEQAVAQVIELCLGCRPTAGFMQRHAERIRKDEVGFLVDYLGQWPRRLRSTIRKPRPGVAAMKGTERIISTHFLMKVPSDVFLPLVYREFFDREIDASGLDTYSKFDFDDVEQREQVIVALSQSEEFKLQADQRVLAAPAELLDKFGREAPQGLYWDRRPVIDERWFDANPNPRAIHAAYTPIILWIPGRERLYTYPGVEFGGATAKNLLTANPEWCLWGPKAPIPAGSYKVTIDLIKARADLCMFDICTDGGMNTLFSIEFFASLKLEVPVHIAAEATDLEFRIFNLTGRKVDIELNEISLSRIDM